MSVAPSFGFRVSGAGLRIQGFRVQSFGFRASGPGFRGFGGWENRWSMSVASLTRTWFRFEIRFGGGGAEGTAWKVAGGLAS
jgi:hypothetical protein